MQLSSIVKRSELQYHIHPVDSRQYTRIPSRYPQLLQYIVVIALHFVMFSYLVASVIQLSIKKRVCDRVQQYWTQVHSYISQLWDRPLRMSPVTCLLHCFRSEDTESDEIPGAPPLVHVILLVAKRCLLNKWLEADLPTMDMLTAQIRLCLFSDRVETERHKETKATAFFKKWRGFVSHHLTQDEINDLMTGFQYTSWYSTEDLKGTLGRLRLQT